MFKHRKLSAITREHVRLKDLAVLGERNEFLREGIARVWHGADKQRADGNSIVFFIGNGNESPTYAGIGLLIGKWKTGQVNG
jgi:hypothetical protein